MDFAVSTASLINLGVTIRDPLAVDVTLRLGAVFEAIVVVSVVVDVVTVQVVRFFEENTRVVVEVVEMQVVAVAEGLLPFEVGIFVANSFCIAASLCCCSNNSRNIACCPVSYTHLTLPTIYSV